MSKLNILKFVNILLGVTFIIQLLSSVIIILRIKVLKPGMIFEIHEYNGIIFILLVLAHVSLNWGWIKANIFKLNK